MKKQLKVGQALISLLAFIAMASVITTAAVSVAIITARSGDDFSQGNKALSVAESGAENAILRLLRDENYTGETMNIDADSVTINVSGTNVKTIRSSSTVGNFSRTVEIIGTWSNNALTISAWKEIN